jgi:hypothetical protein
VRPEREDDARRHGNGPGLRDWQERITNQSFQKNNAVVPQYYIVIMTGTLLYIKIDRKIDTHHCPILALPRQLVLLEYHHVSSIAAFRCDMEKTTRALPASVVTVLLMSHKTPYVERRMHHVGGPLMKNTVVATIDKHVKMPTSCMYIIYVKMCVSMHMYCDVCAAAHSPLHLCFSQYFLQRALNLQKRRKNLKAGSPKLAPVVTYEDKDCNCPLLIL